MIHKIDLSPNHSKKARKLKDIKFVIIHYTGMQSEIESLNRLKDPKHKVSAHYLISRAGSVTKMINERMVAWHAGKSKWKKFTNLNKYSIGIELVNKGHQYGYEKFPEDQIKSLIKLCKILKKKYKISTENFLGHSDIAPLRKKDPGEKFPWFRLSKFKLGVWYKNSKLADFKYHKNSTKDFFKNIYKIGYRYFKIDKRSNIIDKSVVKVFQQKYLPRRVSGKIDQKTLKISYFLAKNTDT